MLACSGICLLGIGISVAAQWARQRALAPPSDILVEYDVEYGRAGEERLLMDIARPKTGIGRHPAVVCIHGGGWRGGDKVIYRQFIHSLAQRGFVAVSVRYRFALTHRFPAQLEDVKSAVRYLRANANHLEVDSDHIGATGGIGRWASRIAAWNDRGE
jgi:acetyl esterase/lipase